MTCADKIIKLYKIMGRPGYKAFFDMLQKGLIRNCNVKMEDARNTFQIYGPDEGALQGKTVRTTPNKVDAKSLFQLPKDIYDKYKFITIAIDIFYFDDIPFF